MLNLPNILTILRVLLIPVLVYFLISEEVGSNYWAAFIFWVIGVSDWLDGYLARSMNLSTRLGAFLDPVADKLCVGVILVMLVWKDPRLIIAIPATIIIAREIFVSGLREWMSELGLRDAVAVDLSGKLKTAAQGFAIIFLIYNQDLAGIPVYELGIGCLLLATILAVFSMFNYIKGAWPHLKEPE
ncbi:MAG: CDP-diacylglycerol--glycerol-3-phosphate 3-phosphatidyltransferase [Salinisphaeraceae bacterium]|nr:CDP-diacylglycerol--glycerol-3-phosphate 3-phosphatidyltransferase [Salinisphaeraceae bacterium]